jgi:hypothetical protein
VEFHSDSCIGHLCQPVQAEQEDGVLQRRPSYSNHGPKTQNKKGILSGYQKNLLVSKLVYKQKDLLAHFENNDSKENWEIKRKK